MMPSKICLTLALALLLVQSPALGDGAAVTVTFVEPEKFTDAAAHGGYGARAQEHALITIRRHLERLGERHLKSGQALRIDILDIDLAGQFEPWRRYADDTRIMREGTWPRIKLRYVLEANGQIAASATEAISDLNYLWRVETRRTSAPLPYETGMLTDWFRARIVEGRPPPA